MKKIYILSIFCLLGWFASYRLDGFDVAKIYSPLQEEKNREVESGKLQEPLVHSILDQKFYYLSRGHQCFVFVSEDQKYVLKLINHARFTLPRYLSIFSFIPQVKALQAKRFRRLEPSFQSFYLAYHRLQQETGLVFLQLNKEKRFQKKVTLVDKVKIEHQVDIDQVEFMIQKKGEMIYPSLCRLWDPINDQPFKQALISFANIIKKRSKQCIVDDDVDVGINYGFIGEKAILIDPGRLFVDLDLLDKKCQKKERTKSTKQFRKWLKKNYPAYLSVFEQALFSDESSLSEAQ